MRRRCRWAGWRALLPMGIATGGPRKLVGMRLDMLGIRDWFGAVVTADDVTERVVDLQSRINTAEASVERLRTFLENATNVQTIADLENQLLQRVRQKLIC